MTLDCKEWEGSLEALVHFLYDLESKGVMLDMRSMYIKPNPADRTHLKGSFVIYCAYMRERPANAPKTSGAASHGTTTRKQGYRE